MANSSLSPFAQVKAFLKDGLAQGRWPAGVRMPSEADLVSQFGYSRMTVNRALKELQAEGLVNRSQGKGSFAAPLHKLASRLTIRDLHEEIESEGHRHHAVVHLCRAESAQAELANRLGLNPGDKVFHTLIVHHRDGVPLQCEDRYVNPACAPSYLEVDFTQTTPTAYLLQVAPLWEAQYSIEAGLATSQEAGLLQLAAHEPCLILVRRTLRTPTAGQSANKPSGSANRPQRRGSTIAPVVSGTPITLARLVHPGNRYTLEGQFLP